MKKAPKCVIKLHHRYFDSYEKKIALTNLSYSAFNSGIHLIAIWLEKVKLVFPKKTKQD